MRARASNRNMRYTSIALTVSLPALALSAQTAHQSAAATGKTLWEYEYENPFTNDYSEAVGPGPYAMPQVVGDRVVTASGTGKIHSLHKKTGKPKWSHDLYNEFHATQLKFGYACHGPGHHFAQHEVGKELHLDRKSVV